MATLEEDLRKFLGETTKSNEMEYYLLKEKADYADEFDTEGYLVLNSMEYAEFKRNCDLALLKEREYKASEMYNNGYEFYFGTNEYLYFEDIQEAIDSISVEKITKSQANTLQILGLLGAGLTPITGAFLDKEHILSIVENAFE